MNYIHGTSGNENMIGRDTPGSDYIQGYEGFDVLWGGEGKDIFVIYANDPQIGYLVKTFCADIQDGVDLIDLSRTGVTGMDQVVTLFEYDTDIIQSDVFYSPDGWPTPRSPFRVYLAGELDTRFVVDATDFIFADTPQYWLTGGNDTAQIGDMTYSVWFGNGGTDMADFGACRPVSGIGLSVDLERGRATAISDGQVVHLVEFQNVTGTRGQDIILGDKLENQLVGGRNADQIDGGDGDDRLFGGIGADQLTGGVGNDILTGEAGYDRLYGGAGADIFVFGTEDTKIDSVRDFADGVDKFDVSAWGVTGFDQLVITQAGRRSAYVSDGEFSFRITDTVALDMATITADDFVLDV